MDTTENQNLFTRMVGFNEFWAVYPRRRGSNPKHPASLKFATAVKNGADPAHIISSACRYAEELRQQGKLDTEFVCMAQTWLNQRRWLDYAPVPVEIQVERDKRLDTFMTEKGYIWNGQRWSKIEKPPREAGADNHSPDTNVTS